MKLPSKWHTYLQEGCASTKQVIKFKQLLSKICLNFFHSNVSPLQNQTYVEVRNEALNCHIFILTMLRWGLCNKIQKSDYTYYFTVKAVKTSLYNASAGLL